MARWQSRIRIPVLVIVLVATLSMGYGVRVGGSRAFAAAYQPVTTESACLNAQEKQFLTLINQYRATHGLAALKASKTLSVSSYYHSRDMGTRHYFAHNTKTPLFAGQSGPLPWDRMRDAGYGYSTIKGENNAGGYTSAQSVFNAWKASDDHNANMLRASFKVIGIGMATIAGSPYGTYWSTDFGGVVDTAAC
jgi:uncharacterized protein YkwD